MNTVGLLQRITRAQWVSYCLALAAVALVSGTIGVVLAYIRIPNISMLYLIAVLITAVAYGRKPAVFASIAAFLTFDWFFVEPLHTFTIYDPAEWVALLLLLLTALITGQLAAGQRRRARQAEQREMEAAVLYDVVRLVGNPDLKSALKAVAERLRRELHLVAVAIELVDNHETTVREVVGDTEAVRIISSMPTELLSEGKAPSGEKRAESGRWVRVVPPRLPRAAQQIEHRDVRLVPVKSQDLRVGTIVIAFPPNAPEFDPVSDRLLSSVAVQLGLAVERRRLRREATEAEVLRRTDELRTTLLNMVSHDLRTPLASIMASAGSLLQKDVPWTEEERDQFASAIERESGRLNRIVGNLLDLSRIQAGSIRPELDWYDLRTMVDDVLGRLRPLTSQHQLVIDIQKDLPPVPLDYVEIDQVISNLIENAVKYSPVGTEIRISVHRDDKSARFEVADLGPGIPAEAMHLLFKPYSQLDVKGQRSSGIGLGLAVARGLVEAHGGEIWAENRHNGGAKFIFTLPLTPQTQTTLTSQEHIA